MFRTASHTTVRVKRRKILVVFSLVEDSDEITNQELKQEIYKGLSETCVQWCREIESIQVIDE